MSIFLPKNHLFNVIDLIKLSKICFISQSKKWKQSLFYALCLYSFFYISFIYLTIKKHYYPLKTKNIFL